MTTAEDVQRVTAGVASCTRHSYWSVLTDRSDCMRAARCLACGLQVGIPCSEPDCEVTPDVACEIRAAELASMEGHWNAMSNDERNGWLLHCWKLSADAVFDVEHPDEEADLFDRNAGWLAREIATHGVTP